MRRTIIACLTVLILLIPALAKVDNSQVNTKEVASKPLANAISRAESASRFLQELIDTHEYKLPKYMVSRAEVIAVFSSRPNFGNFSGVDGVGLVSSRDPKTGEWLLPIFLTIDGGQIDDYPLDKKVDNIFGQKVADLVLIGMTRRTVEPFLGLEYELGSDLLVLPGSFADVSSPGYTPPAVTSGFFSYLRFGDRLLGIPVVGSKIKQDEDLNDAVYEIRRLDSFLPTRDFVHQGVLTFTNTLNKYAKR